MGPTVSAGEPHWDVTLYGVSRVKISFVFRAHAAFSTVRAAERTGQETKDNFQIGLFITFPREKFTPLPSVVVDSLTTAHLRWNGFTHGHFSEANARKNELLTLNVDVEQQLLPDYPSHNFF